MKKVAFMLLVGMGTLWQCTASAYQTYDNACCNNYDNACCNNNPCCYNWDNSCCDTWNDMNSCVALEVGYRQDDIHLHSKPSDFIDSTSSGADYTTKYKDLNIITLGGKFDFTFCNSFFWKGWGDYGWIVSGKHHRHSDFFSSSFFDSEHSHTRGHVIDVSTGIGYWFSWNCNCNNRFSVAPVIGYSFDEQKLHNHVDDDDFTSSTAPLGHSSTKLRWYGPWVGADLAYDLGCNWKLCGSYEFHWGEFRSHIDVPSIFSSSSTFSGSIHHKTHDVDGNKVKLGIAYSFANPCDPCSCGNWFVAVNGTYQHWRAHGKHREEFTSSAFPSGHRKFSTTWNSWGVAFDVGYCF